VKVTGEGSPRALEVVDDSADGLDVGVLGLPLVVAAVVSTLHDVHAATEVRLLVHHPAEDGGKTCGLMTVRFLHFRTEKMLLLRFLK